MYPEENPKVILILLYNNYNIYVANFTNQNFNDNPHAKTSGIFNKVIIIKKSLLFITQKNIYLHPECSQCGAKVINNF